jgi:hypothetical protein
MKLSTVPNSISSPIKLIIPALVIISRLGLFPANISPLGSYGFFSRNFFLYFATIIIFDRFVGGFYSGFWVVYLGFLVYPLLGKVAGASLKRKALLLPIASFLFFIISNLGVFYFWYPHTLEGLLTCYTLALPFYTRTLIGDVVFGYGYLVLKHFLPQLFPSHATIHSLSS